MNQGVVGLIVNPHKPGVKEFLDEFLPWLDQEGLEPVVEAEAARMLGYQGRPAPEFIPKCRLILSLGGDGTILKAARMVARQGLETPIMGINLGGLGFLAGFGAREARDGVRGFLRGEGRVESRFMLKARASGRELYALNEFALTQGSGRLIQLELWVGEIYLCGFAADGVLIATPTGSTAYSLAAGGPVVEPTTELIIVTPICPHTLSLRPIIFPADADRRIKLVSRGSNGILVADGQESYPLPAGERVEFAPAERRAWLVMPTHTSFYQVLRSKLHWGGLRDG